MKVGIYCSNNATSLKKILKVMEREFLDLLDKIDFVLIDNITNVELKERVLSNNIKFYEKDLDNKNNRNQIISDELVKIAVENKADYIFIFCDKILKGEILEKYVNKIINFHPAILPSFKGLNAIDKALNTDVLLLGNTAHFINKNVDEGIMIMQSLIARKKYTKYEDVLDLQIYMFIQILDWLNEDRIVIHTNYCEVKRSINEIETFIPQLTNKKLIEIYNKNVN